MVLADHFSKDTAPTTACRKCDRKNSIIRQIDQARSSTIDMFERKMVVRYNKDSTPTGELCYNLYKYIQRKVGDVFQTPTEHNIRLIIGASYHLTCPNRAGSASRFSGIEHWPIFDKPSRYRGQWPLSRNDCHRKTAHWPAFCSPMWKEALPPTLPHRDRRTTLMLTA